jgi:hypothetical protein
MESEIARSPEGPMAFMAMTSFFCFGELPDFIKGL